MVVAPIGTVLDFALVRGACVALTAVGTISCISASVIGAEPAPVTGRVLTEVRDWRLCLFGVTCTALVRFGPGCTGGFGGAAAIGTTPGFPPMVPGG